MGGSLRKLNCKKPINLRRKGRMKGLLVQGCGRFAVRVREIILYAQSNTK